MLAATISCTTSKSIRLFDGQAGAFFNWLVEPGRRVVEVVGACSAGISERGLRGFGAVGCAEPLLMIIGIAVLAGAWTLRVFLESLKGPSKEVLAAKRHLEKQQKKQQKQKAKRS